MSAAVHLKNLTLSYDRHPAVHHVSGEFTVGSLTALAGPNGAGKSTLLKGIAHIIAPNDGEIILGEGITIAYLPQAAELQRDFPLSVLQMVTTGFWHKTGGLKAIKKDARETAGAAIATVGLGGFEGRKLSTLSAGQFQRALFARLLVQDASLILLDEPFTAIDAETTTTLLHIILRWHKEGRSVICALHDLDQIRRHFPDCLLLARRAVAWGKSSEVLQPKNLTEAKLFHEAWDTHAGACAQ